VGYKSYPEQKQDELNRDEEILSPVEPAEEQLEEFDLDSPHPKVYEKSQRRWLLPLLLGMGIGIALAVVGSRVTSKPAAQPAQPNAVKTTQPPASISVTVEPVATTQVARTLDATGSVAAKELLSVYAKITGLQIKEVLVKEGDAVVLGQIMAVLDDSILQSQLQQAKAQVESSQAVVRQKEALLNQARATLLDAERTLKRFQYLAERGAISRQDLDVRSTAVATATEAVGVARSNIISAQADVRSNQAKIQQIQTQLGQTLVRAPGSGIVVAPPAQSGPNASTSSTPPDIARVGDLPSVTQPLFSIIHNGLELQATVTEAQIRDIRIGAPVRVTQDNNQRIDFSGRVREIAPQINQTNRLATVKIDLPTDEDSSLLRPGMFLKAAITTTFTQGLTVPAKAVLPQVDGKAIVYLLEENDIARAQAVETGTIIGGESGLDRSTARIEIKNGLKVGDRVIVSGAGYLKDGDRVKVVSNPNFATDEKPTPTTKP